MHYLIMLFINPALRVIRSLSPKWFVIACLLMAASLTLSFLSNAALSSGVLVVFILLAGAYLPVVSIFHPSGRQPTMSEVLVYMASGLSFLAMTALVFLKAGFPLELAVFPWVLGGIILAFYRRQSLVPSVPRSQNIRFQSLAAWIVVVLFAFPLLACSIRIGRGDFPQVFFNHDTPYFIEKTIALSRASSYPPPSLSFFGEANTYHYGTFSMSAIFPDITGLDAHNAMFLVITPLLLCAIIAVSLMIAKTLGNGIPRWLSLLLILFPVPTMWYPFSSVLYETAKFAFQRSPGMSLRHFAASFEPLGNAFHLNPYLYVFFITLFVLYYAGHVNSLRLMFLATLLVGTLHIFKVTALPPIGLAFGVWILIDGYKRRSWKVASLGLVALAAMEVSAVILGLNASQDYTIKFAPFAYIKNYVLPLMPTPANLSVESIVRWLSDFLDLLIKSLPVLIIAVSLRKKRKEWHLSSALFVLAPLLILNLTTLIDNRPGFEGIESHNWRQIIIVLPIALGVFLVSFIKMNWAKLTRCTQALVVASVMVVLAIPLMHRVLFTAVSLFAPSQGYEYQDNTALAQALRQVPVEGTLIVTNDLMHKREGFGGDLRLTGLFGHQFFASNFIYERYSESEARFDLQLRFRDSEWDRLTSQDAEKHGWTHLLINKRRPHSKSIVLPLVFRNEEYEVYHFDNNE